MDFLVTETYANDGKANAFYTPYDGHDYQAYEETDKHTIWRYTVETERLAKKAINDTLAA